jgi:hypothetical protein
VSNHQVGEDGDGVWMCGPECPFDDMHYCPKHETCHKHHVSCDPYRLPVEAVPDGWAFLALSFEDQIYSCDLRNPNVGYWQNGKGTTPRAAMLSAIEKLCVTDAATPSPAPSTPPADRRGPQ